MNNTRFVISSLIKLSFLMLILFSCEKETEVIIETETVIVTDTITIVDTVTITETIIEHTADTATTFILVRHAETAGTSSNRGLSSAGQARAEELSRILNNVPLSAVFSTDYNRTKNTAAPTTTSQSLTTEIYDPFELEPFVEENLIDHLGEIILVVGHSNTTPSLVNELIGENTYSDFSESEYDNLFIVTVFEQGRAEVVHMKYGN